LIDVLYLILFRFFFKENYLLLSLFRVNKSIYITQQAVYIVISFSLVFLLIFIYIIYRVKHEGKCILYSSVTSKYLSCIF